MTDTQPQATSGVYTSQSSYLYSADPIVSTTYQVNPTTTQYVTSTSYDVTKTSPYTSNVGTTSYDVTGTYGKTSDTYGTTAAAGTYGTSTSGTYGTYGTTDYGVSGTTPSYSYNYEYKTTTENPVKSGLHTSGTGVGGTSLATPGLSTSQVIGGTNYIPVTTASVYTTQPAGTYTAGDSYLAGTSYSNYQPTTTYTTTTYTTGNYGGASTDNSINDFLGGLRTSVIYEIKKNIEDKGPQFGKELRSYLESNVAGKPEENRQTAVLDTLKEYNLVSSQRLSDPKNIWQNINPHQNDQASNIPGSYLPNPVDTKASYTIREPAAYTSTYQVTTTYDSTYKTPERNHQSQEVDKRASQSPSRKIQEGRQTLLSPYRSSNYKEFELVEDLPDRKNLIDSINLFLRKSPQKEALLVSPSKVSITRKTLLSPAKIEVSSPMKEKYEDGTIYEGEEKNGTRHGKGKLIYKDGRVFEGEFTNGEGEGKGILYFKNGRVCYEGNFARTRFEGRGVLNAEAPIPLQGEFDYKNLGLVGNQWTRYEGEFRKGEKNGNGTLVLTNGERYEGEWRNDQADGRGTWRANNGSTIQGTWKDGVWQY